jgi:DNA-binding MarR family transcriptional regulator
MFIQGARMSVLKREIAQQRPFSSPAEEALLNLMRTADCLQRAIQRKTRPFGITSTQYNVLRILRGSQPQGLTCSAIGDRMITAEPDITRLLARMKAVKLVRQQRDKRDKRVVWTHITAAGLALLDDMAPMVQQYPLELLGHLNQEQMTSMIHLLELARKNCDDTRAPVSCDGKNSSGGELCAGS